MKKMPWKSWEEWKEVYSGLFESLDPELPLLDQDMVELLEKQEEKVREACRKIVVWQARGHMPKIIEITKNICLLWINKLNASERMDDESLRHLMAAHLIRAVNAISDHFRISRTKSISTIAGEIKLPQLLVDLRHDSTHKDIPSVETMKLGLSGLLKWLYENYWQKQYAMHLVETANFGHIEHFIRNFGKSGEERKLIKSKKDRETITKLLSESLDPYTGSLSFAHKCALIKLLLKEMICSMQLHNAPQTLSDMGATFLTKDSIQIPENIKYKIKRTVVYQAFLKSYERNTSNYGVKIIYGGLLDQIIAQARKYPDANLKMVETGLKYTHLFKIITSTLNIPLKRILRSGRSLTRKLHEIFVLRNLSFAACAVFDQFPEKMQKSIKIHFPPSKIEPNYNIDSNNLFHQKHPGTLLFRTINPLIENEIISNEDCILSNSDLLQNRLMLNYS